MTLGFQKQKYYLLAVRIEEWILGTGPGMTEKDN